MLVARTDRRLKMSFKLFMNVLGGLIAAYGLEAVLIPNNVSDGGITGISIVGSQLSGLPLGIFIGILNLPFIYLGYKQIGKSFAILSVTGIASLSVGTVLMHMCRPSLTATRSSSPWSAESFSDSGWGSRFGTGARLTGSTCSRCSYPENSHSGRVT